MSRWSGLCETACHAVSVCVGKRGREQRRWQTLIFRSDRQSSGNFLLAADPSPAQSQSSQGHLAAGRRAAEAVNGPLKGMSRIQNWSKLYKYFIKGNENIDFAGHDFNDAEDRIMCQSQRDVHWTRGWCRQEGEERPRSVRLGTLCQKYNYVNKLGLYLGLMWSSGLRTRLRSCIREVRQGQFPSSSWWWPGSPAWST